MTANLADADIPLPRLRTISHLWTCGAVFAAVGVAALAVDTPLANWVHNGNCPSFIHKLCALAEVFGHGLGVIAILITIAVLDPWHRFALPRIASAALGSGVVADVFKLLLARSRPHHFDLTQRGIESFAGWFPMLRNSSWEQSFPSSHAATAAGFAIALACYYPRGRWLFPALATLAGCQRVFDEAHFLSDVMWGGALGCFFAPLCVYGSRLGRSFDRLEERLLSRSGITAEARLDRRKRSAPANPSPDATRAA